MVFFYILKYIYFDFFTKLKNVISLSVIQNKYKGSKFYPGCNIRKSEFFENTVVFNNVTIYDSIVKSHTYIQKDATVINCEIGKFCSIAKGVSIGPGIHYIDGVTTHPSLYIKDTPLLKVFSDRNLYESSKRTIIGNDVWIGERAIILDGVSIGDGAIIAAGSVVTKSVEPYQIVGGVPAKLIRYRYSEQIIDLLLRDKWWNKSSDWIAENWESFYSIDAYFKDEKI
ncbi:CatB-related O-acetyltransferase [Sphingobacterium spiritivorum]|uniref:CatB-related O-acetyltransferase n=1 Tax=Sphingobacterium spiritivorum TaxID=258 RepID=UPI003DA26A21